MGIRAYFSYQSPDRTVNHQQTIIRNILDPMEIDVEYIDVSSNRQALLDMRKYAKNEKLLAPQLFNGNKYLGDFDAFQYAVDDKKLTEFLQI